MDNRPKIKLVLSTTDKLIESISWLALIGLWYLVLANYSTLPETIPIHFNLAGKADGFGNKGNLFILPIISTIVFIAMSFLNKYPHTFNYLKTITEENALYQYSNATRFIRFLKLITVIIFGLISFEIIQIANKNTEAFNIWLLPLTLGLLLVSMAYYIIKMKQK